MQERSPLPPPVARFDDFIVVVGGGTVDLEVLRSLEAMGGRLVAADGGADRIAEAGLTPELIIGDLDSLSAPAEWAEKVEVLRIAEQDTTDFEKVLYSTTAPLTVALGMTGKRFDHTLAALDAATRHGATRRILLVDESDVALTLSGPISFAVAAAERVSVHPLGPVRFAHSEGLLYPLDGLLLAPGLRTGTSNSATAGPFRIAPVAENDAPYLLIVARTHLAALVSDLRKST